ncbi:MAG: hypothetical protein ACPL3P_04625 [Anaerolineales bacterium]
MEIKNQDLIPNAGLILLRAEWFDTVVALPGLADTVQLDAQRIHQKLSKSMRIAHSWVINSPSSLTNTIRELKQSELDLVVLLFQVWAEDYYLQPIVEAIGRIPLALWCYQPWKTLPENLSFGDVLRGSGLVGTLEGMGTLRNLGNSYFFTWGSPDDERPIKELSQFAKIASVRNQLKKAQFGLLPRRNDQMQSTFVDEFRLRSQVGPSVQYLSVGDLLAATQAVSKVELEEYLEFIKAHYPLRGVSMDALTNAARASLGLAHLVLDRNLDILSFDDIADETHRVLGLRPCLYPPLLFDKPVAITLEGDLGAATAVFILQRLTMSAVFFVEFWVWDEQANCLIGGHAGVQNPNVALPDQIWISPDYEFAQSDRWEGAQLQFITKPGRVTLLQLRSTPTGWRAIAFAGESLGGKPRLEGYPHALIRSDVALDLLMKEFARVGTTQHFAMVYGDVLGEIEELGKLLDIPVSIVQSGS